MESSVLTTRRLASILALFLMVITTYLAVYGGDLVANDELQMLDTTGSLVEFGDFRYDLSWWYTNRVVSDPALDYPVPETRVEHMQTIAAAPLYWLAQQIPGIGLVHTVWLLNVLVSGLIAGLFYVYVLRVGFDDRTALVSALVLVFMTLLAVYTMTFFREPLATFFLLLAVLCAEELRRALSMRRFVVGVGLFLLLATCLWLMFHTKDVLLAVVPGVILLAVPKIPGELARRISAVLAGLLLLLVILLAVTPLASTLVPDIAFRVMRVAIQTSYTQEALQSYVFSIGASLWGTSPVLLLALPGAWMWWRRGEHQRVLALLLAITGVMLAYALFRGPAWFGATWPPRFLLPVVPLALVLALPVIERFLKGVMSPLLRGVVVVLLIYSLWWQVSGVLPDTGVYNANLPPEANGFVEWPPGQYNPVYIRPVIITPVFLADPHINSLWNRTGNPAWGWGFALLAIASGGLLIGTRRLSNGRVLLSMGAALLFITSGIGVFALRDAYRDPRYLGENDTLHDTLDTIQQTVAPGDIVIINDQIRHEFFLNYAKVDGVRFVGLGFHPGERGSFEQEPAVTSEIPDDLMSEDAPRLLHALAAVRDRLWLYMETGPLLPWSIRPTERFMTMRYYPVREITVAPDSRLLEYATTYAAPDPFTDPQPEQATNIAFDDAIRLDGFTLPGDTQYAAGDDLPVTLFWSAETALAYDVMVAFFLVAPDGAVVAQGRDSGPAGGFMPSSAWQPGDVVLDNRALRIPAEAPPGDYRLWLRLYYWTPDGQQMILPVTQGETGPEAGIVVLPPSIIVD